MADITATPQQPAEPGLEPVAVVGLSLRVPGAANEEQFWRNLLDGVESVSSFTRAEQIARGAPANEVDDPSWVSRAPVVEGFDRLDAGLFGMTAREAELMNPQHRLFLEACYAALQDAGYDPGRYPGTVGVYAGTGSNAYLWRHVMANRRVSGSPHMAVSIATGNSPNYVATTPSYKLNLRGPSMTVHTACSTSLVAVHLGCQGLRNYECDMALVGGANIELPQGVGYLGMQGFTSPDGHCRPFDAGANGTVWGSGVGAVLIKRLSDAIADGDTIRAVLLGTAINNDGAGKVGFTAPSQDGQAEAIAQAVAMSGIDPRTITYVEAHGTGTALGDPIEVAALTSVYSQHSHDRGWCGIGSVKSNIGHLSQAAGIVSLIKAVLAIEHGLIPPTVNYESPNPGINFDETPFYVTNTLTTWNAAGGPRRAAVSSFGIGGTNAHVVLEQAPGPAPRTGPGRSARPAHLLQLSARTPTALDTASGLLADHLAARLAGQDGTDGSGAAYLADAAATLRTGRPEYQYRAGVVATDLADAVAALRTPARRLTGVAGTPAPRVALLFSGQGSQYPGMGAHLYATEPRYAAVVDECAELLRPELDGDIRDLILGRADEAAQHLAQTRNTQPALFVVEYALARLWQELGLVPDAMIGHSIGEYVAATLAGVFTLPDALRVVAGRGRLMQSVPAGAMLAVQLDESEIAARLPEGITVATVNGPGTCVVAGPIEDVDEFARQLKAGKVGCKRLRTSHAFHSAMMDPILAEFAALVGSVPRTGPRLRFLSNVTGTWIDTARAAEPGYWAEHLRSPVRFGACVASLLTEGTWAMVECGPGRQLAGLARMGTARGDAAQRKLAPLASLPGPGDSTGDLAVLYGAVGSLWAHGLPVRPGGDEHARRVRLPVYPFERERYWIDPDPVGSGTDGGPARTRTAPAGPRPLDEWFAVPAWRQLPPDPVGAPPGACVALVAGARGAALVDALRAAGTAVVEVRPGDGFAATPDGFVLRPGMRADYDALVAAVRQPHAADRPGGADRDGRPPLHLVHAFALDGQPAGTDIAAAWSAQEQGLFSALFLVQALAAAGLVGDAATGATGDPDVPAAPVLLDLVTRGTGDVRDADLICPEQATLAALPRVLPAELSGLVTRLIDADPQDGPAAALVAELGRSGGPAGSPPAEVALRGTRRWVLDYEQVRLDGTASAGGPRTGGRYLITGGLGGIGITLAEDLAARYRAKLVLLSRSGLPPRERWDEHAAEGDRTARAIAAIRRMERAGGEVVVVAGDVTDPQALLRARAMAEDAFGGLDGIVHAAGLPGGGLAEVKREGDARRVLAPKLAGTLALATAFGDLPLDFVVLCSSVTSVIGGLGQVDYCAANAFLDAYARGRHGWPTRVLAQNWAGWAEVGMAVETAAPAALRALASGGTTRPLHHPVLATVSVDPAGALVAEGTVSAATHWVLDEHRIGGVPVVPGTAHLECARAAAASRPAPAPGAAVELRDVAFLEPFRVPDGTSAAYRVDLSAAGDFQIRSGTGGAVRTHVLGTAGWAPAGPAPTLDVAAVLARCRPVDADAGVAGPAAAPAGSPRPAGGGRTSMLAFGPHWNVLEAHHAGDTEELALIRAAGTAETPGGWVLQPALLDVATAFGRGRGEGTYLPLSYGRVEIRSPLPPAFYSHLRYRDTAGDDIVAADLTLAALDGTVLVSIEDFVLRRVDPAAVTGAPPARNGGPVAAGDLAAAGDPAAGDLAAPGGGSAAVAPSAGIRPTDGAEAFRRSLAAGLGAQVVIAQYTVAELRDRTGRLTTGAVAAAEPAAGGTATGTAGVDGADLEASIAAVWRDALGVESITADDDFFALGGNSLVAVQLIAAMRAATGVRLPMGSLFETPTVAGIAARIREIQSATGAGANGDGANGDGTGANGANGTGTGGIPRVPRQAVPVDTRQESTIPRLPRG